MQTQSRRHGSTNTTSRRRGSVFPIFIIALVVLATVTGSLLKTTLLQRKRVKADNIAAQADWLAISALDRAAARLTASTEYSGEDWKIASETLGGKSSAIVNLTVQEVPDSETQKQITVRVNYAPESAFPAQVTRTRTVSTANN